MKQISIEIIHKCPISGFFTKINAVTVEVLNSCY